MDQVLLKSGRRNSTEQYLISNERFKLLATYVGKDSKYTKNVEVDFRIKIIYTILL